MENIIPKNQVRLDIKMYHSHTSHTSGILVFTLKPAPAKSFKIGTATKKITANETEYN